MRKESITAIVESIDRANARYILQDDRVVRNFEWASEYLRTGKRKMAVYSFMQAKREVQKYRERFLTPANIQAGDGVTVNLWSDRHAATVIRVTKKTVTCRRDTAVLSPDFKPDWIVGGFAAHCTNQDEQSYSYKPDENGEEYTFYWSEKYQRYGQPGKLFLTKGRHEFYDYNF